jgi:hypothetical protein
MVAVTPTRTDLHSFRIAHPVVRTTSRFEVTAAASLTVMAMVLWLLVLPLEFVLHLQMTF